MGINQNTVKVEILGSVIFSVNGKKHHSVRGYFRYYVLQTIRCAFIRMYTRQPRTSDLVRPVARGGSRGSIEPPKPDV